MEYALFSTKAVKFLIQLQTNDNSGAFAAFRPNDRELTATPFEITGYMALPFRAVRCFGSGEKGSN